MIRLSEKEFAEIVEYMRSQYGINLEKKKVLIECRMAKELDNRQLDSFTGYLDLLKKDEDGKVAGEMINRLTTNYTYFFREPAHFRILQEQVFPDLFRQQHSGTLNIWCAGCSTGEECYSVSMTLQELNQKKIETPDVHILGTDISQEALSRAEKAIYPIHEMDSLPQNWKMDYCHLIDKKFFQIDDRIKKNIRFKRQNLMAPERIRGKFDVIFCRNVMIYFDKLSRQKLIKKMEACLNPGGYLLIGHAELLGPDETSLVQLQPAVYQKKAIDKRQKERENL